MGCKDESGFMLVHVAIASKTNNLIKSYDKIFKGV